MRVGAGVTSGRGLSEFLHPFLGCIPCWGNLDLKIHACACPERVALGVGVRRERPFLGLQAFPAEAWSTRAAVNQSFSEALRGGERKSSPSDFGSNPMRLFRIIIPLTALGFSRTPSCAVSWLPSMDKWPVTRAYCKWMEGDGAVDSALLYLPYCKSKSSISLNSLMSALPMA